MTSRLSRANGFFYLLLYISHALSSLYTRSESNINIFSSHCGFSLGYTDLKHIGGFVLLRNSLKCIQVKTAYWLRFFHLIRFTCRLRQGPCGVVK